MKKIPLSRNQLLILIPIVALIGVIVVVLLTKPVAEQPSVAALPTKTLLNFPTRAPTRTKAPGCTVASPRPTPGPTERSLFPAERQGDWASGPLSATVTIIEYGDYQ